METIQRIKETRMGFIASEAELAEVAKESRLHRVLVRCGGGRFVCPAQDAQHFIDMIKASDDYVRDISLMF